MSSAISREFAFVSHVRIKPSVDKTSFLSECKNKNQAYLNALAIVCVGGGGGELIYLRAHAHTHTRMRVCVCVCVRARVRACVRA